MVYCWVDALLYFYTKRVVFLSERIAVSDDIEGHDQQGHEVI